MDGLTEHRFKIQFHRLCNVLQTNVTFFPKDSKNKGTPIFPRVRSLKRHAGVEAQAVVLALFLDNMQATALNDMFFNASECHSWPLWLNFGIFLQNFAKFGCARGAGSVTPSVTPCQPPARTRIWICFAFVF